VARGREDERRLPGRPGHASGDPTALDATTL